MTICKIKLAGLILILFLAGCREKDELTLPVRIHLKFYGILSNPQWVPFPEAAFLEMTEGKIGIQKIEFEGIRETGGNVSFETDPDISLPVLGFTGQFELISDFDIPQGVYNTFKWDIYLKSIEPDESINNNDIDSLGTGLFIKGNYHHIWWNLEEYGEEDSVYTIPFIFFGPDTGLYSDFKSNVVLSGNKDYEVVLQFNLADAFESISSESLEVAEISGDGLNQKVIISKEKNKYLYDDFCSRLRISFSLHYY
jgi:hypothetical protein